MTAAHEKQPFATRVVCQFLGIEAERDAFNDKIGVFARAGLEDRFDNSAVVLRALGDDPALVGGVPAP